MKSKTKKWYISIWSEGKYIDLWSLTHFLTGAVIAGVSVLSSVPFWISVIILFFLLFLWEWYEIFKKLHETAANRALDIALGLIGYTIMYIVMNLEILNNIILFLIIAVLFIVLNLLSWIAYQKSL